VAQADTLRREETHASIIRPAMGQAVRHASEMPVVAQINAAADTAHLYYRFD
jgi:hypothetical protein